MDARLAAELTARLSYGKLLAILAAFSRDLVSAEDALSEAFASALETWTSVGVPANPEAWLITVARRKIIDRSRQKSRELAAEHDIQLLMQDLQSQWESDRSVRFKDERLKLLFVCAHPAIDEHTRTPLMLQTVLGIDAAKIASPFVVSPASMGRRLGRAKQKIKASAVPFEIPDSQDLPQRLSAVLEAIYAAYGSGWDHISSEDERLSSLTEEAIWLARLVVDLLPNEAETKGLLSLMLYCESRRRARRNHEGHYVPLDEQSIQAWDRTMIAEAESLLAQASALGSFGRFQLEAAIQSAHILRRRFHVNNWRDIAHIYEGLVRFFPTLGSAVGRAGAILEAEGPEQALQLLNAIPETAVIDYQPFWALYGEVQQRLANFKLAKKAFQRAAGLAIDAATRDYLMNKAKPEPADS